ncbi:MAG: caspase family protein [Gammaproteobacteria bacterium]|nr:caspase family protein [Gammaproteobacteria bacterium]
MNKFSTFFIFLVSVTLVACSPPPKFKAYTAPEQKTKIVEKIVYKGNGVDSEKKVREDYAKLPQAFTYKKNRKSNNGAYALVIGINNYSENTNVDYADNSALAFEQLANETFGIPKENIITLLNDKASSGQLKAKIELVKELAEKGSNLYVYFAGHGVPGKDGSTYLLPADMSADSIHLEPNLKLEAIYKKLSQSLASNVYVFMDSCFSGKDDAGKLLYKGVAPVLRTNKTKVESKKLTIFTAGASTDFANDFEDKKHRLFSYYLLNELSQGGKDLSAMYEKIRRKVKRNSLMKGIGYKQVPQLYSSSKRALY